jgi:hypothetical protein
MDNPDALAGTPIESLLPEAAPVCSRPKFSFRENQRTSWSLKVSGRSLPPACST